MFEPVFDPKVNGFGALDWPVFVFEPKENTFGASEDDCWPNKLLPADVVALLADPPKSGTDDEVFDDVIPRGCAKIWLIG